MLKRTVNMLKKKKERAFSGKNPDKKTAEKGFRNRNKSSLQNARKPHRNRRKHISKNARKHHPLSCTEAISARPRRRRAHHTRSRADKNLAAFSDYTLIFSDCPPSGQLALTPQCPLHPQLRSPTPANQKGRGNSSAPIKAIFTDAEKFSFAPFIISRNPRKSHRDFACYKRWCRPRWCSSTGNPT